MFVVEFGFWWYVDELVDGGEYVDVLGGRKV